MELERMHHQSQAGNRPPPSRLAPPHANMEHLNLSLPLHVQVPPLPSPNTTAAAAALFRVNQLPSAMSPSDPHAAFGFKSPSAVAFKKRHRLMAEGLGIFAPSGDPATQSIPTPTTAAAAAAAMALSAASPASAASVEQYEQNKRAMLLEAAAAAPPPPAPSSTAAAPATDPPATADALSGNEMRRRKVGIPKFLRYLFQMLEYEDHAVIAWSHDGAAFQIRDPDELAERILPKYFKHNKVSSFQRQLNYFGFKKWTKTQTNICTFSHPHFIRDEQDKMRLIKRKERSARKDNKNVPAMAAADNDDGDDHESDDHDKPPPAKRAKASTPKSLKRPVSARSKKELKQKNPPRAKKSPRGAAAADEPLEPMADDRPQRTPGRKLPTISPNSSSTASTPSGAAGFGRAAADAAPVLPVHADMLQQQQPPFMRRFPYDNSALQDLSEAFAPTTASWPQQPQGEYAPFKFADANAPSLASFDAAYANNANNANNSNANAKDYLDVLLESANMDEQLAAQAAAAASDGTMGWEASYQPPPASQGYAREQFAMLSTQSHGMQLPSIEDLQGGGRY